MAEPTTAPAEGAGTPAVQAADPVAEYIKQSGLTPEAAVEQLQRMAFAESPEGRKAIVDAVKQQYGADIAKEVIAANPALVKDLDSRARRVIRRAAMREEVLDDDEPTPDVAEQANGAVEALRKELGDVKAATNSTAETAKLLAQAMQVAPQLMAFANKHEIAADNYEDWQNAILPRIMSGKPRYTGVPTKVAIERAHEDIVAEWEKAGARAGMVRPAAPTPGQSSALTGPKQEDIEARFAKARTKEDRIAPAAALLAELPSR